MGKKLAPKEVFWRLEATIKDQKERHPILTREEEGVLIKAAQEGNEEAKKWILLCNRGFVIKTVRRFFPFLPLGSGINIDQELIQVAESGLIYALKKFDPKKGNRLGTYAKDWVRQFLSEHLRKKHLIVIPARFLDQRSRVRHASREFLKNTGRPPTVEELRQLTGLTNKRIEEILDPATLISVVSFNTPLWPADEKRGELLDVIKADDSDLFENASFQELKEKITKALSTLSEQEKEVIELRFGFGDGNERTLEEIGKEIGRSRERVRQIEKEVKKKLQKRLKELGLDEWLEGE